MKFPGGDGENDVARSANGGGDGVNTSALFESRALEP